MQPMEQAIPQLVQFSFKLVCLEKETQLLLRVLYKLEQRYSGVEIRAFTKDVRKQLFDMQSLHGGSVWEPPGTGHYTFAGSRWASQSGDADVENRLLAVQILTTKSAASDAVRLKCAREIQLLAQRLILRFWFAYRQGVSGPRRKSGSMSVTKEFSESMYSQIRAMRQSGFGTWKERAIALCGPAGAGFCPVQIPTVMTCEQARAKSLGEGWLCDFEDDDWDFKVVQCCTCAYFFPKHKRCVQTVEVEEHTICYWNRCYQLGTDGWLQEVDGESTEPRVSMAYGKHFVCIECADQCGRYNGQAPKKGSSVYNGDIGINARMEGLPYGGMELYENCECVGKHDFDAHEKSAHKMMMSNVEVLASTPCFVCDSCPMRNYAQPWMPQNFWLNMTEKDYLQGGLLVQLQSPNLFEEVAQLRRVEQEARRNNMQDKLEFYQKKSEHGDRTPFMQYCIVIPGNKWRNLPSMEVQIPVAGQLRANPVRKGVDETSYTSVTEALLRKMSRKGTRASAPKSDVYPLIAFSRRMRHRVQEVLSEHAVKPECFENVLQYNDNITVQESIAVDTKGTMGNCEMATWLNVISKWRAHLVMMAGGSGDEAQVNVKWKSDWDVAAEHGPTVKVSCRAPNEKRRINYNFTGGATTVRAMKQIEAMSKVPRLAHNAIEDAQAEKQPDFKTWPLEEMYTALHNIGMDTGGTVGERVQRLCEAHHNGLLHLHVTANQEVGSVESKSASEIEDMLEERQFMRLRGKLQKARANMRKLVTRQATRRVGAGPEPTRLRTLVQLTKQMAAYVVPPESPNAHAIHPVIYPAVAPTLGPRFSWQAAPADVLVGDRLVTLRHDEHDVKVPTDWSRVGCLLPVVYDKTPLTRTMAEWDVNERDLVTSLKRIERKYAHTQCHMCNVSAPCGWSAGAHSDIYCQWCQSGISPLQEDEQPRKRKLATETGLTQTCVLKQPPRSQQRAVRHIRIPRVSTGIQSTVATFDGTDGVDDEFVNTEKEQTKLVNYKYWMMLRSFAYVQWLLSKSDMHTTEEQVASVIRRDTFLRTTHMLFEHERETTCGCKLPNGRVCGAQTCKRISAKTQKKFTELIKTHKECHVWRTCAACFQCLQRQLWDMSGTNTNPKKMITQFNRLTYCSRIFDVGVWTEFFSDDEDDTEETDDGVSPLVSPHLVSPRSSPCKTPRSATSEHGSPKRRGKQGMRNTRKLQGVCVRALMAGITDDHGWVEWSCDACYRAIASLLFCVYQIAPDGLRAHAQKMVNLHEYYLRFPRSGPVRRCGRTVMLGSLFIEPKMYRENDMADNAVLCVALRKFDEVFGHMCVALSPLFIRDVMQITHLSTTPYNESSEECPWHAQGWSELYAPQDQANEQQLVGMGLTHEQAQKELMEYNILQTSFDMDWATNMRLQPADKRREFWWYKCHMHTSRSLCPLAAICSGTGGQNAMFEDTRAHPNMCAGWDRTQKFFESEWGLQIFALRRMKQLQAVRHCCEWWLAHTQSNNMHTSVTTDMLREQAKCGCDRFLSAGVTRVIRESERFGGIPYRGREDVSVWNGRDTGDASAVKCIVELLGAIRQSQQAWLRVIATLTERERYYEAARGNIEHLRGATAATMCHWRRWFTSSRRLQECVELMASLNTEMFDPAKVLPLVKKRTLPIAEIVSRFVRSGKLFPHHPQFLPADGSGLQELNNMCGLETYVRLICEHDPWTRRECQRVHTDRMWRQPSLLTTANLALEGWTRSRTRAEDVRFLLCPRNMMEQTLVKVTAFLFGIGNSDILATFEATNFEIKAAGNDEDAIQHIYGCKRVVLQDCAQEATKTQARSCLAAILCEAVRVAGRHFVCELRSIIQLHDHYLSIRGLKLLPTTASAAQHGSREATVRMLQTALWERVRDVERCIETPGHMHEDRYAWISPTMVHVADMLLNRTQTVVPAVDDRSRKAFLRDIGVYDNECAMHVPIIELCSSALRDCVEHGKRHVCTKQLITILNQTIKRYKKVFPDCPFEIA